jgi:hypothetical protein
VSFRAGAGHLSNIILNTPTLTGAWFSTILVRQKSTADAASPPRAFFTAPYGPVLAGGRHHDHLPELRQQGDPGRRLEDGEKRGENE